MRVFKGKHLQAFDTDNNIYISPLGFFLEMTENFPKKLSKEVQTKSARGIQPAGEITARMTEFWQGYKVLIMESIG